MASTISHSAEDTFRLGHDFAARLHAGDVIALAGDLGAGKTQWVKGLAAGLGCDAVVTSPTFTLLHEYPGGRLPLFHVDCYRLESAGELLQIGIEEYMGGEGILVVEWADKFPTLLGDATHWLRFEIGPGEDREIVEETP